ncbi:2,3-bisphosphoglycerate-independent phosphoglycerate mutase [Atopobacter phocae]|uniref:2,3-bisphosphoglycerate-independent phosphoglycerate mutase n=1 Tax=Atopobacter phocae TaxID=136492 RepID=UPI00046F70C5|nr:2,3-bisphosphoglycerate-independent phosphoglycerate mutase [Atopobacter phocae]
MKKKVIVAIADGIGDLPVKDLGHLTPLEYADTPNLDRIAKEGITGMMDPISPGIPVGTDMGHLVLFGNDHHLYPGRGPIEAAGEQMDIQYGDIAFRCNFATRIEGNIVKDRRAGRIRKGTNELAQVLNGTVIEDVTVMFKEATEHRAVLVLRGEGLSANVSDTDPKAPNDGHPFKLAQPTDDTPEAEKTARILNKVLEVAYERFKEHPVNIEREENGELPANFIITRGAGQMTDFKKITEELKFNGAVVAGESTVLGMAKLSGMTPISNERFTGNMDTDIILKADMALKALEENDIVYVHLKVPDIQGHDKKPLKKAEAIERFDQMVGHLLNHIDEMTYIALVADHSTPCSIGEHSGDPVPIAIAGYNMRRDKNEQYNETDCSMGGLGRISGHDFVWTLLDLLERVPKQGN